MTCKSDICGFHCDILTYFPTAIGSDFDDVDEWIQHGGQASFQGLGNLADLSESKLLSTFSERLESMSWGIAVQFRHVLMNLSKEIIG